MACGDRIEQAGALYREALARAAADPQWGRDPVWYLSPQERALLYRLLGLPGPGPPGHRDPREG